MSCATCGCATQPCGCCEGVQVLTPQDETSRPGLPALSYRAGTHASFMQTMQARLSTIEVEGLGSDGQMLSHLRPLQGLTTRDPSDPSIALLDAWATVGDVLTFYQERNANEAYLRTATERRSVLELARLVGYTLRPGVAATAFLAYTLDANQKEPVTIAAGARSQSVPDPDETAQAFETSDDLIAQREWNNLQVRLHRPQNITLANALGIAAIQVAGVATNLKPGDKLLLTFSDDASASVLRNVAGVDTQFADQRSVVSLQTVAPALVACVPLLADWLATTTPLVDMTHSSADQRALQQGLDILRQSYLGVPSQPQTWVADMNGAADGSVSAVVSAALTQLGTAIDSALAALGIATGGVTTPAAFATKLLLPPVVQARNSLQLPRSLSQAFLPAGSPINAAGGTQARARAIDKLAAPVYADVGAQLLVNFVPDLKRSYYAAWAGASLNPATAPLKAVYAMRARASLFGATASKLPTYADGTTPPGIPAGVLLPQNLWGDWHFADKDAQDETPDNAFLDQANENIVAGGYAVYELDGSRGVLRIAQASTQPRTAYGLSGQTTQLVFDPLPGDQHWRSVDPGQDISDLRKTKLYVQSDPLTLAEEPITTPVNTRDITLDGLYDGLTSGRWVVLSGERADIDDVTGVKFAELQMISGLTHSYDATLPGDQVHTTVNLATALAYAYKRETLVIYGNVVKATNGETRNEVLGNGEGAQALQSFTLKQPPLTFVAAPTAAGAQSTLTVRVNDVQWHESDSLAALGPKDRAFITLTDDTGVTSLNFGDGEHGARLPTGVLNVKSVYRNGIGQPGNVKAGQITLLQTKPLGVKAVINPLRASGGADKETRDLARENAPLSVLALDRLVSVSDYTAFTRRFAGIAKALALQLSDGQRQLVYLTIAGVDDIPIDTTSDLYVNLLAALRQAGNPDLPLRVDTRDLKALVLSANIKLLPDYEWEAVVGAVRAQLLDAFGFDRRALGQPALLCEVIAAIQAARGVAYVDVDAFGAIAQTVDDVSVDADGTTHRVRRFLTQDDIAAAVAAIVQPGGSASGGAVDRLPPNVDAWPGGSDRGLLRPAELVMFMPDVSDTLVLNQIP
ncbi:MAG TPA: putative baseplate assembly protein [Caldimonas sp.]